jgi:aminopeptidase N
VTRRLAAILLAVAFTAACSSGGDLLRAPASTTAPAPASTTAPAPTTAPAETVEAENGADGAGDPYFPRLGNGGYDVARYDLAFDVTGVEIVADVTIDATATSALDTFNLDFAGFTIEAVTVDGEPAAFDLQGSELVVDPTPVIEQGAPFVVEIGYRGRPTPVPSDLLGDLGWQRVGAVTFVSNEPDGAHTWFPGNDHPSDKAAYRISITVPEGITAIASGVLVSDESDGITTTWVWDHPDPIPTYVLALAYGPLTLVESEGPHGIHIRHAFPPALAARATRAFDDTAQLITDLEEIFGPYPFDSYGVLIVPGELGYAMESQTFVLYPAGILDGSEWSRRTMVHELAHHWYGNWVTPAQWSDVWLNEGFATYAEYLWLEHTTSGYDIDGEMRALAEREDYGPIADPGAGGMFGPSVYARGALTLHALRRTMGDAGFFRLLRAWPDRFGAANASSDDLADLASEIAGDDLHPFFDEWLSSPAMPALPS